MTGAEQRSGAGEVVAIVPAAGHARRLGPLPCSKEILPVGWRPAGGGVRRPRVVIETLLEALAAAAVDRAIVVLRTGKWDIPAALGDGARSGLRLVYLPLPASESIVETIDAALPLAGEARVVLGFPDVLFAPLDAVARMRRRQEEAGAEVVLGLFPTDHPHRADLVERRPDGRVVAIEVKPSRSALRLTWMLALWTPRFSRFLSDFRRRAPSGQRPAGELYPGHVVQAAIESGLRVDSVAFEEGSSLDIGEPADYARALRRGLAVE